MHRGTDGHFYMLDFARLFPPETPTQGFKASFLVRLLRPELVLASPKPLCSDAFSLFQKGDPDWPANNADVHDVCVHLLQHVIPQLAKDIETGSCIVSPSDLVAEMHRKGTSPQRARRAIAHYAKGSMHGILVCSGTTLRRRNGKAWHSPRRQFA